MAENKIEQYKEIANDIELLLRALHEVQDRLIIITQNDTIAKTKQLLETIAKELGCPSTSLLDDPGMQEILEAKQKYQEEIK